MVEPSWSNTSGQILLSNPIGQTLQSNLLVEPSWSNSPGQTLLVESSWSNLLGQTLVWPPMVKPFWSNPLGQTTGQIIILVKPSHQTSWSKLPQRVTPISYCYLFKPCFWRSFLVILAGDPFCLSFLAILAGVPFWPSFLAILPGYPFWQSFLAILSGYRNLRTWKLANPHPDMPSE